MCVELVRIGSKQKHELSGQHNAQLSRWLSKQPKSIEVSSGTGWAFGGSRAIGLSWSRRRERPKPRDVKGRGLETYLKRWVEEERSRRSHSRNLSDEFGPSASFNVEAHEADIIHEI